MADTVQVKANLQEELSLHLHFIKLKVLLKTPDTHGVKFQRLQPLMANVKIQRFLYQILPFQIYFVFFCSKCRSRSWSEIFAITPIDCKCHNLQMTPTHFCASSYLFRDIKISNLLPSKSKSRSQSAIFAITPFHGKFKIYKCLSHNFTLALTSQRYKTFQIFYLQK